MPIMHMITIISTITIPMPIMPIIITAMISTMGTARLGRMRPA